MKFHEVTLKFRNLKENHVSGCPEANMSAATIEKALELLVFLHGRAVRLISCKVHKIP